MSRENIAKRLGIGLRERVPDVTWRQLPTNMLRLLVKISEMERLGEKLGCTNAPPPPSTK